MDDNSVYRSLFFEESDDNLQQLNDNVLELESEPDNMDLVNEIFRAAHTLKGMAATMGYDVMTKLTHKMENLFDFFKSGKLKVNSDYISLIFRCLDRLSQLVEDLRDEKELSEDQISDLLAELAKVEESVNGGGQAASQPEKEEHDTGALTAAFEHLEEADLDVIHQAITGDYKVYSVAIRIDKESLLKGPRVFLIMEKLEQEGDVLHTEPSVDVLEDGDFDTDFRLVYLTKDDLEMVKHNVDSNSEIDEAIIEPFDEKKQKTAEKQQAEAAQAPKEAAAPQAQKNVPAAKPKATAAKPKKSGKTSAAHHHANARNQSIRVDLTRLDRFLNLVSELVVYRNQLDDASMRNNADAMRDALEQVSRLTSELQDLVLKIRMQQVSVVFSRFPRMVRDLANELHKEMELVVEGEETELDKTVVSELSEPLIHLLRNSSDHGIESPEIREQEGKDRKGTIKLSAYQEGNRVIITLEDDGKGLDPAVIKASAESKGINTEGMSDDDIKKLIFHPGFSTAKKITNISGRGVGLDAVQAKISELGGSIEMKSELHVGTKFIIKLPLTLSIIQALMVRIGNESFAVPLDVVERVVMLKEDEIVETTNQEVYHFQDSLIPIIRTDHLLQIKPDPNKKKFAIIVKIDQKYYGVLADELIGQQEIVIKKIDPMLQKINKYQGATIFGNGEIALILDVNAICNEKKGNK
ncbi:chemotaxis protein CheA [Liquorilactobacillus capillatus]|uniref:Chemotaxis protein CheA n=2 Tax=Liquorilactobacillus capillatus TaxID=480931 RepID=A0A0R1M2X7_9LACO|nr:chemotaxis protein CheA [Liquorilactobacillus capillatus]AJA33877.1 two-component system chemotaxis family sensor kinase CheA [Liquorilactobacillus capillatus]KRL02089.1 chemotaxis protein CheA [Liquorilactobacillus capillatus DSM 19910]